MPAYNRTAREALRLPDHLGDEAVPPWAVFDPDWYRQQYPDAPASPDEDLLEWHLTRGQTIGHAPNRWFDEEWQREAWRGIPALIESGAVASAFDAWCRGPTVTRPPHWLFDPREYQRLYPAMADEVLAETGFVNHYHHYLSFGAAEHRAGHPLFDPAIYLEALVSAEAETAAAMPFLHYLRGLEGRVPEHRTSLLFDPDWYRVRYPDAWLAVEQGHFRSLLEHYLRNDQPLDFDPSPWFSEKHYLTAYPGLAEAISPEGFRNGFAHFLAFGLEEGRSPNPDLDLIWYAGLDQVRADIVAGRARDGFVHWIAIGAPAGLPGRPTPEIVVTPDQAAALYQWRANTIWPLYGRHKLDFTRSGTPAISVVMAIRNHFAETMVSLASLRAQYHGDIDLILIVSDPALPAVDIETHLTGATILRFGTVLNDSAVREAGLICAVADSILFLGDGADLAPGAVANALARLSSDPAVGAVGGRLVQPDGSLWEAGGIIWRDGQLQPYARNASPLAAEANFVRDTDFCSTLFLLARRDVLVSLPDQAEGIAGTTHDAAELCARVQREGLRVVYDPDVLIFLTNLPSDRMLDGKAAFVAAHADYVSGRPEYDPETAVRARSPTYGRTRVLFIEDSIPLRRIGSGFVRSNDVLRAMTAMGSPVTVFPMKEHQFPLATVRAELPDTIEVMHELSAADFPEFMDARRDCFDLIWVARTHNLDLIHATLIRSQPPHRLVLDEDALTLEWLAEPASPLSRTLAATDLTQGPYDAALNAVIGGALPLVPDRGHGNDLGGAEARPRIVVDTEAIASVREAGQASLWNQPYDLDAALRQEFRHLDPEMDVVAVSEAEAALIRPHHLGPIAVLGHALAAAPTPRPFAERSGMLFVGAIHGMDHPNYDGLAWFIDEVLPIIERTLRWETRLTVVGYLGPGVTLDRFSGHPRVTLRGEVSNLTPVYDAARLFVAPARFAAGIPYKVHEAAAFGVPVVTTSVLAGQLGWPDAEAIGAADVSDPTGFASRVIALHRDAHLWTRIRDGALARVTTELDPGAFARKVANLVRNQNEKNEEGNALAPRLSQI